MAKKKSTDLCTRLGCKTTSDALLAIMLGIALAMIIYFVALKANADSVNDTLVSVITQIYGVIAIVTLAIILIEKLQKKMTMMEAGRRVITAAIYLIIMTAAFALAKVIAGMFGLI